MTVLVMAYAVAVGTLLALAGPALERITAIAGRPRRAVWALLLFTSTAATALPWVIPADVSPAGTAGALRSLPVDASAPAVSPAFVERVRAVVDAASAAVSGWDRAAIRLWAMGTAIVLLLHLRRLAVLRRRRRAWHEATVNGARVYVADADGPGIAGSVAPAIVLPRWALALESPALDVILTHERQHIAARDPLLLRAAAWLPALTPWNPAAWWMLSRLELAVEIDCDARVLRQDVAPVDAAGYAELLLAMATRRDTHAAALAAPAMIEPPSTLGRRIAAMIPLRDSFVRTRIAGSVVVAAALIALSAALPAPRMRAQPAPAAQSVSQSATPPQAARKQDEPRPAPPAKAPTPRRATPPRATAPTAQAPGVTTQAETPPPVIYEPGNGVTEPKLLQAVDPMYTSEAMRAKIQGVVLLSAIVNSDGTVGETDIIQGFPGHDANGYRSPGEGLEREAIAAAKQWRFEPSRLNGVAVPVRVMMEMNFRLH